MERSFQLMMGYGVNADPEKSSKALPTMKDDSTVYLGAFAKSARKCAHQLIELVEVKKNKEATETALSASAQTHVL
jgi:hypothetical protein